MLSPIYCFLLKIFRISHFTSLLFFTLFSFYQLVSAELEEVTYKDTAAVRHIPCEICPPLNYTEHGWKPIEPLAPLQNQTHVTVVIDVFRAFTTASYILEFNPATYIITTKTDVISQLARELPNILVIGKPEKGADFTYDIPNSPTRVQGVNATGQNVLHRTEAGAKGILLAWDADIILAAGFVNAKATAQYIRTLINPKVKIVPMGHESTTPSLEDDVCAQYIQALINCDEKITLPPLLYNIHEGPGRYFFSEDQWQYPHEDFEHCLEIDRFNFAIQATVQDNYAILTRCNQIL